MPFTGFLQWRGRGEEGPHLGRTFAAPYGRWLRTAEDPQIQFAAATDRFTEGLPDDCLYRHAGTGVICATDARIDNIAELAQVAQPAAPGNPAALLAGAYLAEGPEFAARLCGDFAAAIWDPRVRRLVLVADAFASRGLFFCSDGRAVHFATDIQTLGAQNPRLGFDPHYFAAWLMQHGFAGNRSPIAGLEAVEPGCVVVAEDGKIRQTRYWHPAKAPDVRFRKAAAYVEAAEALMTEAVRCRLPRRLKVATHLSGGLDSTIVAGTAAKLLSLQNRRLPALTRVQTGVSPGWAGAYWDEHHNAAAFAAGFANMEVIEVSDGQSDLFAALDAILPTALWPAGGSLILNAWGHSHLRTAKRYGVDVLLTGVAGNQTISQTGTGRLSALLRRGQAATLAREWAGLRRYGASSWHLLHQTFSPYLPALLREPRRRLRSRHLLHNLLPLRPEITGDPGFRRTAKETGLPDRGRTPREIASSLALLNTSKARDWTRQAMGIEARSPFLDRRVVEFCAGLPYECFLSNGETRHLARQLLRRLNAPQALVEERRHGVGNASWHAVLMRHRAAIREEIEALEASSAAKFLDLAQMRQLLGALPSADPANPDHFVDGKRLCIGLGFGRYIRRWEGGNAGPPLDAGTGLCG